MGLTSRKVLLLAALAAVLLFAVTVWVWPRLARRGVRPVLGRVGLLFATQLALFAAVGLAANDSFLFYGSWADLFGRQQDPGVVVDHASDTGSVTVVSTRGTSVPAGTGPSASGRIEKVVIAGPRSGIDSPAYVYLPPEYFQPRYAHRTFPAAVVLTGYPGTAENLISGLDFPRTAWRQVKAGRARPMILVMLRPTVAPPRDTECVDVPGGPRSETFFAEDVPNAVGGTYRVGAGARSWGFIGDSTGGYCALKIALHHPDRYAAGVGLSAYYKAADDPTTGDLFHGDKRLRDRSDLLWSLDHGPAPKTSFLVTSSKRGEDNLKATRAFIAKVRAPARVSSIILDSGGHNFNTWRREIPAALEWLSGRLAVSGR
jgi:enterochelin esterase-like enzyme